jgi:hypothetical protein
LIVFVSVFGGGLVLLGMMLIKAGVFSPSYGGNEKGGEDDKD